MQSPFTPHRQHGRLLHFWERIHRRFAAFKHSYWSFTIDLNLGRKRDRFDSTTNAGLYLAAQSLRTDEWDAGFQACRSPENNRSCCVHVPVAQAQGKACGLTMCSTHWWMWFVSSPSASGKATQLNLCAAHKPWPRDCILAIGASKCNVNEK